MKTPLSDVRHKRQVMLRNSRLGYRCTDGDDVSSTYSGSTSTEVLAMPALTRFVLTGAKLDTPRIQSRSNLSTQDTHLDMEYEPNPEVAPYKPSNFMSSTILKKVPIPERHLETFGSYEYSLHSKRGIMLHTDRYHLDLLKSMDGPTQRERLQAEMKYMEAMRGTRRLRETVPHRAEFDLIMGGKQIEFEERFDIGREIQKLKAIAMPTHAKDLFHGRGIRLPSNHMSVHPRHPMPNDLEEEISASAPVPLKHLPSRAQLHLHHELPHIYRDLTSLGRGGHSRETPFKRLPQLPQIPPKTDSDGLRRDLTSLSRSNGQAVITSREMGAGEPAVGAGEAARFVAKGTAGPLSPKKQTSRDVKAPTKPLDKDVRAGMSDRLTTTAEGADDADVYADGGKPLHTQGSGSTAGVQGSKAAATGSRLQTAPFLTSTEEAEETEDHSAVRELSEDHVQSDAPHPLKGSDLIVAVPEDEQEELRQAFQRLDTDSDGHIQYNQLKTQLSTIFTEEQEKFTEEVYNLTNSVTYFGIDEFMVMNRLAKTVEGLTGKARESFAVLDFSTLQQELIKYVGQFQSVDTGSTGRISVDGLRKVLSNTISSALSSDDALWESVLESISLDYSSQVSKVVYIAHIPLFLSLEKDLNS
ncbi:uncharacterized protein LOC131939310 isoform X2 [Physella acuta]|uniref:uncharacterized protein LOC131939310 isoform X2 n=1 Tax=Physella acuta TaxID=109671 RepID=UPI0027DB02D6|nr:uncharacterized protein LOC131939310 isoform X2 [Physella acuta]